MAASILSLAEATLQIHDRRLSCVELTRSCLDSIDRLNPVVNAFITVTADLALDQARRADEDIAAGLWRGPLHGIPIALKDIIDLAGVPTTAASRQLRDHLPSSDAAIVGQLKKAGAVIVGKTNLHEFAFGGSGMVSARGPAQNPWDPQHIAGGSSSGSAAAVATGMCVAAIGTDTAGSVRTPAALCGIVGHRPSAGVWSTDGIIPLRKSFDTAGPMTRTVVDAWLMRHVLAGNYVWGAGPSLDGDLKKVKVGIPRAGFFDDLDADVANSVERALQVVGSLVGSVHDVKLEVGARWSSFDDEILEVHQRMMSTSPELYQPATLERLRTCHTNSAVESEQARTDLRAARIAAEIVFDEVDVLITPTCKVAAPRIADLQAMSATELRACEVKYLLGNTAPFSLLFWPSVSVPCGFTNDGLPVGLQISARPGADDLALSVAHAYEQATEWHTRVPNIVL